MHQSRREENAALLLEEVDEDDREMTESPLKPERDHFPVVAKRPKTYHRHRSSGTHPVLCFTLILGAFVLGCVSGVAIMLYRMSQESEQGSSASPSALQATKIDLTIRTKLFQSISQAKFLDLNRVAVSDNEAASQVLEQWKSYSPGLAHVEKLSYDARLSKLSPSAEWSGVELLDGQSGKGLLKLDSSSTGRFISFSSLIKSGTLTGDAVYFVNYGRPEDFAYLSQHRVTFPENKSSIVFMRRQPAVISETEQIRQAIHHRAGALVLFDDHDDQQIGTANERLTTYQEWARYSDNRARDRFLEGLSNDDGQSLPVLTLPFNDVQQLFGSLQPDSILWQPCPPQWHGHADALKLGGRLSTFKLRFTVHLQETTVQLPVVMGSIRGSVDAEHFVMVGYQLGQKQQSQVINEIIQALTKQMQNGWSPKRSILFCAWSGLEYEQYTIRRWLSENYRLADRNLVAYIDLGNGIVANSTLNLHGSPLLEQIARRAADAVSSPLVHNHTCHQRVKPTAGDAHGEHQHDHGRRRRRDGDHEHHESSNDERKEMSCVPHRLLDEWIRASQQQISANNDSNIVQLIDVDSSAALFQLRQGVPSLLIEMTAQQALTNDTFYVRRAAPIYESNIQAEVVVAYTQYVCEVIRQLIDEPLLPLNLTDYANVIDKQVVEYLSHFEGAYHSLQSHLGEQGEFARVLHDLTKSLRQVQSRIDGISTKDLPGLYSTNKQLIGLERLFISDDQSHRMDTNDRTSKHVLFGRAFGLTNTAVSFHSLANLFPGIPGDPPPEFCDQAKLVWSRMRQHVESVKRTTNGFESLMTKN